jgi:hypothetical protein
MCEKGKGKENDNQISRTKIFLKQCCFVWEDLSFPKCPQKHHNSIQYALHIVVFYSRT